MVAPYLTPDELARIGTVEDFERLAQERMRPEVFDYVRSWAGSGTGVRINREAFERWVFRPRVLRDVSNIDTKTTILGQQVGLPVLFGPSGLHRLHHPDGELATARAARVMETILVLSTSSSVAMPEVVAVAGPRWLQLYWMTDPELTREIVVQAEASGFSAIALTVDAPVYGWRELDIRLGDWDWKAGGVDLEILPKDRPDLRIDGSISWRSLDWLRSITNLPIILKGVLTTEDALIAAEEGLSGIIVSNHGGRQLDYAMATLDALPAIADAVGDRLEVYLDSGVRRGTDVFKALALGARATLLGRPIPWALATGGEAAVLRLLEIIRSEFVTVMGMCGVTAVDEIRREMLAPRPR